MTGVRAERVAKGVEMIAEHEQWEANRKKKKKKSLKIAKKR